MCANREDHPDLMESMTKKGSNVPEKPKTPQQLWYNHEKKAFLKSHPDVSQRVWNSHNPVWLLEMCFLKDVDRLCLTTRRPPKTSRTVLVSSGRSCLTKRGSNGLASPWSSKSCTRCEDLVNSNMVGLHDSLGWFLLMVVRFVFLGSDAGIHPAAPGAEHEPGRLCEVHPDQGGAAPQRQVRWPARQTTSVSSDRTKLSIQLLWQTYSEIPYECFRNGYSMFCAELMSNMKDVPSTERMVMCSQRWKLLKQNDKDAFQKRCEQVSPTANHEKSPSGSLHGFLFDSFCFFHPEEEGIWNRDEQIPQCEFPVCFGSVIFSVSISFLTGN